MRVIYVVHSFLLLAELLKKLIVLPVPGEDVDDARSVGAWLAVDAEDIYLDVEVLCFLARGGAD